MNKPLPDKYLREWSIEEYMRWWWSTAEMFRYLRIKGGLYVVNKGMIG